MAGDSKIQWTQKTWNPVAGCSVLSPGCTNCYAMKMAGRLDAMGVAAYAGLTRKTKAGAVWTGEMRLIESALTQPLRWKKPSLIFVNSMSDLFHEALPDAAIDQVFAVMALAPQHTFQVLTKRAERMREYMTAPETVGRVADAIQPLRTDKRAVGPVPHLMGGEVWWPLPNVWLGVSAEDQAHADERIPRLLATPAAVRFVSAEPLLGAIDLTEIAWEKSCDCPDDAPTLNALDGTVYCAGCCEGHERLNIGTLDWVIVGGESGPGARPMHPDWARQIRDDCDVAAPAGVPFFFKQWGAHAWAERIEGDPSTLTAYRAGKRAAGRLLDGVEHNAMPESA